MGRKPRQDGPGTWHHVVNRGIAKRPLFETGADIRFFLSRIAREVRRGRIEIHAYSILTTHFHLLVRSPIGELSEALRMVQNAYSRRFNRKHRRDGALIRGRFFSKRVDDDCYWRALVRYIDHNPVQARIVSHAAAYPFGSAFHFHRNSGPPWLEHGRIARESCRIAGAPRFSSEVYAQSFGAEGFAIDELVDLVERRMSSRASIDPLSDLVGSTPHQVQSWMRSKAKLADGHTPGHPVCSVRSLERALQSDEQLHGRWMFERAEALIPARPRVLFGLAHDAAGLSWREVSSSFAEPVARCRRLAYEHRKLLEENHEYATRAARILQAALAWTRHQDHAG